MFERASAIDNEEIFKLIRKESKFCSRCGNPLDIGYRNWHLPFCTNCRIEIMAKIKDEKLKLFAESDVGRLQLEKKKPDKVSKEAKRRFKRQK